jgi:hypothetical protein
MKDEKGEETQGYTRDSVPSTFSVRNNEKNKRGSKLN